MLRVRIRNVRIFRSALVLTHDLLAAQASLLLALFLMHDGRLFASDLTFLVRVAPLLLVAATASYLAFGLHREVWSDASIGELVTIVKAATLTIVLCACLGVVPNPAVLVIQWFVLVVGLCTARVLYRSLTARRRRAGAFPVVRDEPVLLYGCGPIASFFIRTVQTMPDTSVRVVGILDASPGRCGRSLHQVPVLGTLSDLDRVLAELAIRGIQPRRLLVAGGAEALPPEVRRALEQCRTRHALELQFLSDMLSLSRATAAAEAVGHAAAPDRPYLRLRRIAEVIVCAMALLTLAPVIAAIALAVLLDLGRPVLFRQVRPGRYMHLFTLYKFRTMRAPCADAAIVPDYERTSALGGFLRRSRLDELPQLFNVLRGDMSFIGPRPLLPRDLPDDVAERVAVRPGITGWAQVNGGHKLTAAEKMAFDRWYVRNASVMVDALILWRTVRMMVLGEEVNRLELEYATTVGHERQRLLAVNRYFHPDECATSQLMTDLVAALAPDRFATTVFSGRQNYISAGATLLARQDFGDAEVRRVWHINFGRFALPGRAIDCLTFAASAFLALVFTARPGDVILVTTDPPLLSVVGWLAARLTGARLVNWCQDMFPEVAAAMGLGLARGRLGRALRALRNASLKGAEVNVALCEAMAGRLMAEGVPQERIMIIHNWADGAAIRPLAPKDNPLRREWGLAGRFVIGYSGNLGLVHEVDSVVELMSALRDEPDLVFLFIGAGLGYRRLRAAAAERGVQNIQFRPYQARSLLPQSLAVPDLHLITLRPAFEGLVMPSKLYGALAAGRPVVFIGDPDGSVGRIVARGLGLVAAPGAVTGLAAEIRALRRHPARLARMGADARHAYETSWNKDSSLDAWAECLHAAGQPAEARLGQAVPAE